MKITCPASGKGFDRFKKNWPRVYRANNLSWLTISAYPVPTICSCLLVVPGEV